MKWIPVSKKLPRMGERVLFSSEGFVGEGYLSINNNWYRWDNSVNDYLGEVIAWMELPECVKEGD